MVKTKKLRDEGDRRKVSLPTRSRKCHHGALRTRVLRMLSQKRTEADGEGEGASGAVTPGYANGDGSKEFLSTGRTGRRNAMPDILGQNAKTGTVELSSRLQDLNIECDPDQPGTSGVLPASSASQEQAG